MFSQLNGTHVLSLVAVSTRVKHGVMPLTCSALVCCTGVCMPRIIEVLGVNTKVGDPGDHQL